MLDKPCRQPVLSLQQHQSIVHLLPFFDSQPFHKLVKISAICYNPPFYTANIQKVTIFCNRDCKIFLHFYDVNRRPPIFEKIIIFVRFNTIKIITPCYFNL